MDVSISITYSNDQCGVGGAWGGGVGVQKPLRRQDEFLLSVRGGKTWDLKRANTFCVFWPIDADINFITLD